MIQAVYRLVSLVTMSIRGIKRSRREFARLWYKAYFGQPKTISPISFVFKIQDFDMAFCGKKRDFKTHKILWGWHFAGTIRHPFDTYMCHIEVLCGHGLQRIVNTFICKGCVKWKVTLMWYFCILSDRNVLSLCTCMSGHHNTLYFLGLFVQCIYPKKVSFGLTQPTRIQVLHTSIMVHNVWFCVITVYQHFIAFKMFTVLSLVSDT